MNTKTLNMEQRKVLKELFMAKLSMKKNKTNAKFNEELTKVRDSANKKLNLRKESKELSEIFKKANVILDKLKKEKILVKTGNYDNLYRYNNIEMLNLSMNDSDMPEYQKLLKEQRSKMEEISMLEHEITADIYSLNVEYGEMIKLLDGKIDKIMN